MKDFNAYAQWLYSIKGIGNVTIRVLMQNADSAEDIYHMSEAEIRMCLAEGLIKSREADRKAAAICAAKCLDPVEEANKLKEKGILFVSVEDSWFPNRLREIPDAPYGLYYIGSLPSDDAPSVAIVGARNCSGYGREQARLFAEKCSACGISVISGMARGIDGVAGKAAAERGKRSYAVLGCGVDVIYPYENKDLYYFLKERGGIISENIPGTQPKAILFPRRNRLISGLSDAVVVIEARKRSGTIITVDSALEQGREIFALPGRVCDALSDGCNHLISQGAVIACSPDTVIEHFYGVSDSGTDRYEQKRKARNQRRNELTGIETVLFDVLGYGDVMETDFLIRRIESIIGKRIDAEEFTACMMSLQMRGLAQEIGFGHYKGI